MDDEACFEAFVSDGHVVQRKALGAHQLDILRREIDECRSAPSEHHAVLGRVGDAVFDSDLFRWRDRPAIGDLIAAERLVSQATLLLASPVLFVEDQWFAADPGSATGSPWHQDGPYYEIDRAFVTCWIALDDVDAAHALHVIPGSHLDGTRLDAVAFDADGDTISNVSHSDDHSDASTLALAVERAVSYDMSAGDALWFDAGTVHGVPVPSPVGGRRFSLRYAPADARRQTTDRPVAAFWSTLPHGLDDGDHLSDSPWFPVLDSSSSPDERTDHAQQ
ncbi:phytanoyl-CoA dioxygenase family protein [Ilumatobacter coccineus]|uniref:Phytanoyl-CoA dioxygenase n=1 Tax=Ilumatobacter coccineus (strain NBRC 103263 / KCTC 29153 / YM16-304) TaxID=1313172 RepID=A0A6C7E6W6_ILUCY|nr:phytanoyl-CoA dioxygenase family protein [Ilumatobacter coccineus]BAN00915.1 hypothetical protein YM304_06010 [Ilumatobacter coccineus YM16-304]